MPEQSRGRSDTMAYAAIGMEPTPPVPLRKNDPTRVGPYVLESVLGSGGMGRVYLGRNTARQGRAAVKVIRPEYAEDPQFRRRFEREVAALGRVRSAHTARLMGSGCEEALVWVATEYIPGPTLADAVTEHGPIDAAAAWRLVADLGRAIEAMWQAGIVHRDLKPSNVILAADGARLIDFGVVQAADTTSITTTGQHVGTPAFMSPEQVRGHELTAVSDVFSMASAVSYAVAGQAPFGEGTGVDVLHRVAFDPPKEEVVAKVTAADPQLAEFLGTCLEKDPERRPSPETVFRTAIGHQLSAGSAGSPPRSGTTGTRAGSPARSASPAAPPVTSAESPTRPTARRTTADDPHPTTTESVPTPDGRPAAPTRSGRRGRRNVDGHRYVDGRNNDHGRDDDGARNNGGGRGSLDGRGSVDERGNLGLREKVGGRGNLGLREKVGGRRNVVLAAAAAALLAVGTAVALLPQGDKRATADPGPAPAVTVVVTATPTTSPTASPEPSPTATPSKSKNTPTTPEKPPNPGNLDIRSAACPAQIVSGDRGDCVAALQQLLVGYGLNVTVDGRFGAQTLARVKVFQTEAGITADGKVGAQTKKALYSRPRGPVRTGSLTVDESVNGTSVAKCLDTGTDSVSGGGQEVRVSDCTGVAKQRWALHRVPGGLLQYTIVNQGTFGCLDADATTNAVNGQRILTRPCDGLKAQRWTLGLPSLFGGQALVSITDGFCLDAEAATSGQNGRRVQGWVCVGNPNQSWNWE
ncbi:protein kinase domain-containing protein [Streptomyces cavernae]|uniref:protein kinase domain-containing protein n=1 Tax=Streptomyces cavernae TaxID=2259034 RepID=UPI0012D95CF7|nr:protein kinase [Streptomyces cavernae]